MRLRVLIGRAARLPLLAGTFAAVALGAALQPAAASAQTVDPATCAQLARLGVKLPLVIIPSDVDRDGDVDIFDYNIVVTNFGKTGRNLQGDVNRDGRVNQTDLDIVVRTFGFHSPCR